MKAKRVFLIVLDSVGAGEMPDADLYGDKGSHTIKACYNTGKLDIPNMRKMGLFNIDGINCGEPEKSPTAAFAKMTELSKGKDTTIGHWEISGVVSPKPLPTYPNGFPNEVLAEFEKQTGRGVLCNKPYSGTQVIADYGREHIETGALIVYTSADSVFQIAAHEKVVPVEELYRYCEIARKILVGKHGVGRVIARPFEGEYPDFKRTVRRHDFSLEPPKKTMLDILNERGYDTLAVGKIFDIFAGRGISDYVRTSGNDDGMVKTFEYAKRDFNGLCFINLVDFDMLYGHRNNVAGYTDALNAFDKQLGAFIEVMRDDDVLMITADHGCDPTTSSTDHSREYTPLLVYGENVKQCVNMGIRESFSDIAQTVLELIDGKASDEISGKSMVGLIVE